MKLKVIVTTLALATLLYSGTAFAMVGAEPPKEGMVGITSVEETTAPDAQAATSTEDAAQPVDKSEGYDPAIAESGAANDGRVYKGAQPAENERNLDDTNPVLYSTTTDAANPETTPVDPEAESKAADSGMAQETMEMKPLQATDDVQTTATAERDSKDTKSSPKALAFVGSATLLTAGIVMITRRKKATA